MYVPPDSKEHTFREPRLQVTYFKFGIWNFSFTCIDSTKIQSDRAIVIRDNSLQTQRLLIATFLNMPRRSEFQSPEEPKSFGWGMPSVAKSMHHCKRSNVLWKVDCLQQVHGINKLDPSKSMASHYRRIYQYAQVEKNSPEVTCPMSSKKMSSPLFHVPSGRWPSWLSL